MNFALMVVLKSTIILAGAGLLSAAWRRSSAATKHAIWALAIISALVLPLASVLLPRFDLPVVPRSMDPLRAGMLETATGSQDSHGGVVGFTLTLLVMEDGPPASFTGRFATGIWIVGFLLVSARFILARSAMRRLLRDAIDVDDAGWREIFESLRSQFSIHKPVRLMFYDAPISPLTWGVIRNVILLPTSARHWTEVRRRLVLTHELAHVRRSDGMMQLAVQMACCVYWFSPIVWYAAHRVYLEREQACDDQVLNKGTCPRDYAGHLVEIARTLSHGATTSAISMAHASPLEARVRSILDSKINRGAFSRLGMVLLLSSLIPLTASIAAIGVTFAVPLPPVPAKPPALLESSFEEFQRARIGDGAAILNPAVAPPQVIRSAQPPYTRDAFTRGIEGTVTIEASIDARGNVTVLRTLKGLGYGLDENAARALGGWEFIPALRNGISVETITQVDVDFILANDLSMNASLSGAVNSAATGAPLAGVVVTAATEPTGDVVAPRLTDGAGTYRFVSLKPGTYRIKAEHPGFEPASVAAPLGPEQAVRLNFALTESSAPTVVGTGLAFRVGGGVVMPPRVIYRVEPRYTEEAKTARIQGTVVLETSIAVDGSVESVQVRRSLGFGLDESAMDSLKQWKFSPATRNGQPVPVSLNIEVNFSLK